MTSRAAMVPVSRRLRAYFAPVNRVSGAPTIFDPAQYRLFTLDAPPAPWIDLGWIDNFERLSAARTEQLRTGPRGAVAGQFRSDLSARIEFDFREWGKLQMALACGSEHLNVLASAPGSTPQPSGGSSAPAVAVLSGSSASELNLGTGGATAFTSGDILAVDIDYQQQVGYVGTGIAAAFVNDPADVKYDVNYIRRVTFNLGKVAQTTETSVVLAQPLPGGPPLAGASAQKVAAFVDREGGSFFQEWSALFIAEEDSGGRVCFHYPHLSAGGGSTPEFAREREVEITAPLASLALHATFVALPYTDENDGQIVVCYRSYFPAPMSALY
jgi:hypothetical protein